MAAASGRVHELQLPTLFSATGVRRYAMSTRALAPAARLEQHADQVLAAVARTRMREDLRNALTAFLCATFERVRERRGRAEGMRAVLASESAHVDELIRAVAGALPPFARTTPGIVRRRIEHKGPAHYGLPCVPTLKRMRRALRGDTKNEVALALDRPELGATLAASTSPR